MWEIILFLLIGCLGGLIGAGFNTLNERLTRWRMLRMRTVKDKCAFYLFCFYVLLRLCSFLVTCASTPPPHPPPTYPLNKPKPNPTPAPPRTQSNPEHTHTQPDNALNPQPFKTGLEVLAVSSAMTFLSFLLPLMWRKCTPLPSGVETEGWTEQEKVSLSLCGGECMGWW